MGCKFVPKYVRIGKVSSKKGNEERRNDLKARVMKRKISIKSYLTTLLLMCWLFPSVFIAVFNFYYINSSHFDNKISKQITQLKYNDKMTVGRLNQVIQLSRELSYDGTIVSEYKRYERGEIPARVLLSSSAYYLRDKYSRKDAVQAAMLWFDEDPENLSCSTYNESVNGAFEHVKTYWEEKHPYIAKYAEELGTSAGFYSCGQHLYLVRNIYNACYDKVAVLVLRVNQSYCFETYSAYAEDTSVTLHLNQCRLQLTGSHVTEEETGVTEMGGSSGFCWENGILRLYHRMNAGDLKLQVLVRFDDSSSISPLYGYQELLIVMVVCFILILICMLQVFTEHVAKPIEKIVESVEEIKRGNLGFQLTYVPKSREFQYLIQAFNHMSEKLKDLFDHVYEEEIALQDARIRALQARLNPHFMNNTLEIINWEARLSGNEKVSQMIEALSTIMDAGIDRRHEPEVMLSEEMVYVNAYFFIISERFGNRLEILKNLPDEIMKYKVPRLILQPVIENAVEHGAGRRGKRVIELNGYREGDFLYLEIVNEGQLEEHEKEKIQQLLEGNYNPQTESSGNMGIANVNQRLQLLYGEDCGLKIEQADENYICAKLTICVKEEHEEIGDEL